MAYSSSRLLVCAPVLLFLAGCQSSETATKEYTYCGFGVDANDSERMLLDFDEGFLSGSDFRFDLEVWENLTGRGFVFPFPLSLPLKQTIEKGEAANWVHGDFQFSMSKPATATKTVLIDAGPLDEEAVGDWNMSAKYSSVFYSAELGVLAISWRSVIEDISLGGDVWVCGDKGFHAADLDFGR